MPVPSRRVVVERLPHPLCPTPSEAQPLIAAAFNEGDDLGVFGASAFSHIFPNINIFLTFFFSSENGEGRWLREVQMDGFGNGEFQMTTSSSNNSYLQNGNLYIVPTLTPGYPFADGRPCSRTTNLTTGTIINPVQSARLSTLIICAGRVEVRAKMPLGDWLWPAIWMLPVSNTYGPWPRSGEIDIVESRGNGLRYTNRGANYVQGSLNWGPNPQLNGERRKLFSSDFHTYVMEWTEEWLSREFPETFRTPEGKLEALQNPWVNATVKNAAPFDQDFYLIMNGDKPWLDHAGNPPDRALVVDYVKMWKHC
ncbi:glycoside hydrolase family 16 protein [Mycena rebaudengoi]|nr:glycoside hydrolase family 16 protein [Mycena rebaudengoi]